MQIDDIIEVKRKSTRGILALTGRTFALQIISFFATFILTIFLSPDVFGIFYVVSAAIAFLNYFSDIGLAAALIQKKEPLTEEDLSTTFTIQQLLVVFLVAISLLASAQVARFFGLDATGMWLFRSLVVAFFLSSLKTIPSVLLERKLEFGKLVIPQLVETISFYAVAVTMAYMGFGVMSFAWAVLVRAVSGLLVLMYIQPWTIRIAIYRSAARTLLRFGIPFQLNSFLALIKDDLFTVFLGKTLPFAEVGYIGWAKKWAEAPLRLFMDSVVRVTFPTYARLQHSKELIGSAIEKTLFGLSASIFPISTILLFFARPVVALIPKYEKWEPALFSFAVFVVASAIASLSTPLTNALNAVGKINITLLLMVIWTVSTWVVTYLFIHWYGFDGVSLALALISSTLIVVVILAKKVATFRFIQSVQWPFMAATVQGVVFYGLRVHELQYWWQIIGMLFVGLLVYATIIWFGAREKVTSMIVLFRSSYDTR